MDSEEFLASPFGSDALDEDVFSPDDIIGGERIVVRLNYNLLCGLYEVANVDSGEHQMLLVFPKLVSSDPDFSARFNDVCARLKKIKDPGLLELKDYREVDGRFCIFYEGFHGICLPDFLAQNKLAPTPEERGGTGEAGALEAESEVLAVPMHASMGKPEDVADKKEGPPQVNRGATMAPGKVKLCVQTVGRALHRLHREGIHHYSLTDSNILTDGEVNFRLWGGGLYEIVGRPLFERLASAGIPPIIEEERSRLLDPVEGLSPEMRRGNLPDARSDLYGISFVAYTLLVGVHPEVSPEPPSAFNPELEKPWDAVLLQGLSRDPKARQSTMDDFIAHLEGRRQKSERTVFQRKIQAFLVKVNGFLVGHIFLLSALLLVLVAGVLFSLWARSSGAEEPQIGPRPVVVSPDAAAATHLLRISPEVAVVEAMEASVRRLRVGEGGVLRLTVRDGIQRLRVRAEGYKPENVVLRPSNDLVEIEVVLEPDWALPRVLAHPESKVFLRGSADEGDGVQSWVQYGEVGAEGRLDLDEGVMAGVYDLEVIHPNFSPVRFNDITLEAGERMQLRAEQMPLPGGLEVSGSPATASVFLGDERLGTPPLRVDGLSIGAPLRLTLRQEGYHPREREVVLQPGEVLDLDFGELERKMIPVELEVLGLNQSLRDDPRLRLRLDDVEVTLGSSGSVALPQGQSELWVQHPDYREKRERLEVGPSMSTLSITLEPRPGVLRLDLRREGAFTLRINGRQVESREVLGLAPGTPYEVEVVLDRYEPARRTFRFGANEREVWVIEPKLIEPPSVGESWTFPYQDFAFVWIAPGEARVGSPRMERHRLPNEASGSGERPLGVLTRGFWMSETTVTQAFFTALGGNNESHFRGAQRPVESISWLDAVAFAEKLTAQEREAGRLPEGYVYRLPTQVEWEYACRAGGDTAFSWGNEARPAQGNFRGVYPRDLNHSGPSPDRYGTLPVKAFPANPWGLYEMHGNVRELTLDNFNDRYPSQSRLVDWVEERPNDFVPVRGGGWEDSAERSRSASRDRINRAHQNYNTGFRLVLAPEF